MKPGLNVPATSCKRDAYRMIVKRWRVVGSGGGELNPPGLRSSKGSSPVKKIV